MTDSFQFCFNFAFKFKLRRYTLGSIYKVETVGPVYVVSAGGVPSIGRFRYIASRAER